MTSISLSQFVANRAQFLAGPVLAGFHGDKSQGFLEVKDAVPLVGVFP